ncbi:MAG: hypothetical protein SGJ10_05260, partial [Bacteroidota bacterium]|nr:hypothetical protein [Bacteroidota bacterium]
YDSLKREIVELKILVAQLMQEIQLLRNGRNSGNTDTQYIIVQKKGTNPESFRDVVRHYHSTNQSATGGELF